MKWKTIVITALASAFVLLQIILSGCTSGIDSLTASQIAALPFTVPPQFTYNADGTEENNMLTYQSDSGTTLIISHHTGRDFLAQAQQQEITEAALVRSYKNAGLDVAVTDLHIEEDDSSLTYTFTVHLSTQYGSTITRKYIRLTTQEALDLSCGGNVADEDSIDLDYGALLLTLEG